MASTVPRPATAHRWLLVLPFVWQVALVPVVNDVRVAPLNIPFPMLWQMLGVLASTAVIALVFRLDRRAGVDAEEARFLELTEPARGDSAKAEGEVS
ncbi:DUF3311 domain-containing protein [Streptomyces sp. NPDC051684]|uniref:DUF3311 domain-containing protein n=1 Tax=Streptomyces sp. NPDC051684 TaxID=3365670 RepID=UPI0037BA6834